MTDPNSGQEPVSPSMRERARVPYPSLGWTCRAPARFIAFGFGSGLIRPASGTWGTLMAWVLWRVAMPPGASNLAVGLFLAFAFFYGCWVCHRVGKELGEPDHVGMVWDEIAAFWLVLWLSPATWIAQLAAFLLFRLFDIVKPPPIKYFDARLKGGIGVMFDDLLAAVYALLCMAILVRLGVL
jgi:phosphatidylglycerophosphatase A